MQKVTLRRHEGSIFGEQRCSEFGILSFSLFLFLPLTCGFCNQKPQYSTADKYAVAHIGSSVPACSATT